MSECVHACVSDLTDAPDGECDVPVVQSLNPSVPQTFVFSLCLCVKRGTRGTISLGIRW